MAGINVVLAVEDNLSQSVGSRLLREVNIGIDLCIGKKGITELKKRLPNFLQMAKRQPVFLLIDMDRPTRRLPCVPELVKNWMGTTLRPDKLLFRVAVCEIESWLLADHEGMRALFGNSTKLPDFPDTVPDPKECLINLARRAPRKIRELLVPEHDAAASKGTGYNDCLGKWVKETWSPERAAERSPSLKKTRIRLKEFYDRIG